MTITTLIDVEAPYKNDEPPMVEAEPVIPVIPEEANTANKNSKIACGGCDLPPCDLDNSKLTWRSFQRGYRSFKSRNAIYCLYAVNGLCAMVACNAFFSIVAVNSFMSLFSVNSVLSIGSLNSVLAVGCEGEIVKICL